MKLAPVKLVAFDPPRGAGVAARAHELGLPDLHALVGLGRWGCESHEALAHHQAQGDLAYVLVLHLVRGASPAEVGRLACRWCERIPALDRWPATRRVLVLAQQQPPERDLLTELSRTILETAGDSLGLPWSASAVAHAALLVARRAVIGSADSAWRCGRALEAVLRHQIGELAVRDMLVELAGQSLHVEAAA